MLRDEQPPLIPAASETVIAVTHRCPDIQTATELADMAIRDYSDLDKDIIGSISL